MLISRHIIYTDLPTFSTREEFKFDPPFEIDLSIGKVSSILNPQIAPKGARGRFQRRRPIVNANGVLHINEVMKEGETLSIVIRPAYRLENIVMSEAHQLLVLAYGAGLHYWLTIGQNGASEIIANMVKDTEGVYTRLKANLKDIPYRAYVARQSLASLKTITDVLGKPKDIMDTKEAAAYLGVSESWLYKQAASGKIPRTPYKRFRKADLDLLLSTSKKLGEKKGAKH